MLQPSKKMNRNFGRLLAVIFGLTLFFEVACLPLISTLALQVEKSVVAEFDEKNEKDENDAQRAFEFFTLVSSSSAFHSFEELSDSSKSTRESSSLDDLLASHEPAFIQFHSLRI
jgi:hypothetical protein